MHTIKVQSTLGCAPIFPRSDEYSHIQRPIVHDFAYTDTFSNATAPTHAVQTNLALCSAHAAPLSTNLASCSAQTVQHSTRRVNFSEANNEYQRNMNSTICNNGGTMPMYICQPLQHVPTSSVHREQNSSPYNNVANVHDIISIMPTFDSKDKRLTSIQFVGRVDQLKQAYNWDEKTLLFAVQANLRGVANLWLDSMLTVYSNWSVFVDDFLYEFPSEVNFAAIHMTLMNMCRLASETPEMFYYKILSIGRQSAVDDKYLITYVYN